jgi:hypothetical protein
VRTDVLLQSLFAMGYSTWSTFICEYTVSRTLKNDKKWKIGPKKGSKLTQTGPKAAKIDRNCPKDPPTNKHFHACHRIQNPDGAATILRRQSEVFDVQLHSISSPRGEAASTPLPRRTKLKKSSYTELSCSYMVCPAVTWSVLQLHSEPRC